jgi:two-component system cell cycle sensor histidine kinase/response regulator CckA
VEGIVAQSGGHIQIESTRGQGTTIRLLLPLTAEPILKPSSGLSARPSSTSRGRILVVEDEDPVRVIVSRTLQYEGYEVLGARDGKEALDILEEVGGAVSLVLTDIVMPNMGGGQLARELKRRYRDLPLIWMSGHPRETELHNSEVGPDQIFLHKPVAPGVLLDVVAGVLEGAPRA